MCNEQCNPRVWFSVALGIGSYSLCRRTTHKLVSSIRVAAGSKWEKTAHQFCVAAIDGK
jgi:hypothetical protein